VVAQQHHRTRERVSLDQIDDGDRVGPIAHEVA
jgi:hypothetical protein